MLISNNEDKFREHNEMTIDTRHQPRVELEIEIQIIHRNRCVRALTKNLSSSGMFLQADAMRIPTGTFIGLEFAMHDVVWQIDGLVVRQAEEGVGALFRVPQPELFKSAANIKKASTGNRIRNQPKSLNRSHSAQAKVIVPRSNADL